MVCRSYSPEDIPASAIDCFNSGNENFFCSYAWYENFLATVLIQDNNGSAQFLVDEQDNVVQVVLPLKVNIAKGTSSFESLTNYYSPFFQFNTKLVKTEELLDFFVSFKQAQKNWDTLTLHAMAKQDVFNLLAILNKSTLPCIPFFCFANWYLEVNQRSFDEYFLGLSSRVRNTVKRKTKQFNRLDGARIEIISNSEDLEKGIKAFQSVYASSWKDEETFPEFISGLMTIASKQGALRLGVAYLNNVAVAAQLWIVADNTAYIYKLAYDEQYKKLSIGSILSATLMRHVIDIDKVAYVDYLSGDDAYKKEWMSHRRERWGVMIFNWRTLSGGLKMINQYTRFYFKKMFIN